MLVTKVLLCVYIEAKCCCVDEHRRVRIHCKVIEPCSMFLSQVDALGGGGTPANACSGVIGYNEPTSNQLSATSYFTKHTQIYWGPSLLVVFLYLAKFCHMGPNYSRHSQMNAKR